MTIVELVGNGFIIAGTLFALCTDHGIFRRISERLDTSIYRGPADRPSVALTFDDGPTPQTPEVLAYLRSQGVIATFFQCGMQVERYPEIAREVVAQGHEIGNHTWHHKRMGPNLQGPCYLPTFRFMRRELVDTQKVIGSVTGITPVLFRPPCGVRWVGLDRVRASLGMQGIHWSVIGHDWEWPAERIAAHVLARITPGGIICLHDGRDVQPNPDISETLEALRVIVPAIRAKGYTFQTVSALLRPADAPALAEPQVA